jgi:outer membrane protein OmpA-like peptidoglycan-associated protein
MKKILIGFLLFCFSFSYGQQYINCNRAAEINDVAFGPVMPNGSKDKAVVLKHSQGLFFEQGHNISWLTFVVPNDTVLTFDLIPENAGDDLDFLLFQDEDDFCRRVAEKNIKPLRSNMALPDTAMHSGNKGLSVIATDTIIASGYKGYCKGLMVKKGERYYIVVDNWSVEQGGFTLKLHLRFPKYAVPQATVSRGTDKMSSIDAVPIKLHPVNLQPAKAPGKITLHLTVSDSANNPITAQLDVTGLRSGKVITIDTSEYEFTLNHGQTININCNAKGYMFTQSPFTATDTGGEVDMAIKLAHVVDNKSVVLQGIYFHEGNAVFLPTSQNALMNVLAFMRSNPTVNIMIKGYVNDPGNGNSGAAKKLSKERAEAVSDFLGAAGISKKRLNYKGYGNSNMLYANPANDEEAKANRRVEIEVVK